MAHLGPALPTLASLRGNSDSAMLKLRDNVKKTPSKATSKTASKKRKVINGFIGFRAYYSAIFSRYQQKQRSPLMTTLWKQDPFHNEWDFMCSTYSAVRPLLADEGVTLQTWISFAIGPLAVPGRDDYMKVMRWTLTQHPDGAPKLSRASIPNIERTAQPIDSLSLLNECIKAGMRVSDPAKVIAHLSGGGGDVMCVNTKPSARCTQASVEKEDAFVKLVKRNPEMVMSQLLGIPLSHPRIASGVDVYHLHSLDDLNSMPQMVAERGGPPQRVHLTQAPALQSEYDAVLRALWEQEAAVTHNFQVPAVNDLANDAMVQLAEPDINFFNLSNFQS